MYIVQNHDCPPLHPSSTICASLHLYFPTPTQSLRSSYHSDLFILLQMLFPVLRIHTPGKLMPRPSSNITCSRKPSQPSLGLPQHLWAYFCEGIPHTYSFFIFPVFIYLSNIPWESPEGIATALISWAKNKERNPCLFKETKQQVLEIRNKHSRSHCIRRQEVFKVTE